MTRGWHDVSGLHFERKTLERKEVSKEKKKTVPTILRFGKDEK